MKTKLYTILFLIVLSHSWSQTIFSENLGTTSFTTSINNNTFQNSGQLTYSNGAQIESADIRNTNASSGYVGSSGGGNVWFTSKSGAYGFSIERINASNYNSLTLQYAYRKESSSLLAKLSVDYWNGSSWISLASTASDIYNESANAATQWYIAKSLTLPSAAQIEGLKIRFVKTGTTAIRIDDIKLTGNANVLSVSNLPASGITMNSAVFSGTVANGTNIAAIGTVYSVTATNAVPTLNGTGCYFVYSPNPVNGAFSNSIGNVLSPNKQYSYRAFVTNNPSVTTYSNTLTFYTLASTPLAPIVTNPTITSLNVAIRNDDNPLETSYAILEQTTGLFVQGDGRLGANKVFKTSDSWGTVTVSNLESSTTYTFQVIARNNLGVETPAGPTNSATTIIMTPSTASDIAFSASSPNSNNSNLDYKDYLGTSLTTVAEGINGSIGVMEFYLRDGGVNLNDSDNLPTELTEIIFAVDNPANIRSARLFVGNTPVGRATAVNGASTLVFKDLSNIVAGDNSQLAINLRVTFNAKVTDNAQMQFAVLAATAKTDGSLLATLNGGGAISSIEGDINRIEVVADRLIFAQQPPSRVAVNVNMSPSPIVEAIDVNENRDYDFSNDISIASSGILKNSPQNVTAISGFAVYESLSHIDLSSGSTLSASAAGLISVNSDSFDVVGLALFLPIESICVGDAKLPVLPTVSLDGILGFWKPEFNPEITTTYTFTSNPGEVAATATMTIEVNYGTTPTFTEVPAVCEGTVVNDLPNVSLEGITGTWSPELNNEVTTTYIFSPDPGQCASQGTLTIDIEPLTIPEFSEREVICQGGYIEPLSTTSLNGITGTWMPELNNNETTTYIFAPDTGQCASGLELTIAINPLVIPTFDVIPPLCQGTIVNVLSDVSLEGITGTWFPDFNNNQTTEYIFTPDDGQCAGSVSITIVINPSALPEFESIPAICSGENLDPLPTTSLNGIKGTWSPEVDQTVTTTYTFTPDEGPCALNTTMTIVVNPNIPQFDLVSYICVGETLDDLPTTSTNGITGVWEPEINNSETTTYTFTPEEGQCASNTTLTINVGQISPIFEDMATICPTTEISELPLTSNNGINGIWTSTTSGNQVISFTFTPTTGQCAEGNTITIPADQVITPLFDSVEPILQGALVADLPSISLNNVSGTWSPELNNIETTEYTFTPDFGQCAHHATLIIEVIKEGVGRGNLNSILTSDLLSASAQTSNEVGYTPGELSVSSSGSAIYNIPIDVPPGINGVAPKVSLVYNSQAGVGMAGYGWNIAGLSSITRIAATKFHDNIIDPVDFDDNDRYSLDGQRLILKTGIYGAPNSTYETESFSNTKITFTGSSFKVEYPDGTVAYYGQTVDSKVTTLSYALSTWQNAQGIAITYSYIKTDNTLYLNKIKYGGTGNNTGNEIQFIYKNRFKSEQSFVGGLNIINDKILSEIGVKCFNNAGYKNYLLAHEKVLDYERLISVTEKNGNSSKKYNPTRFEYPQTDFSSSITRYVRKSYIKVDWYLYYDPGANTVTEYSDFSSSQVINGDFDGDGQQDFIYGTKLYTNVSDGSNPVIEDFSTTQYPQSGESVSRVPVKILTESSGNFKMLNRDAWCYESANYINNSLSYLDYRIYSKTNNGVVHEYTKKIDYSGDIYSTQTFTGDFNGDGLTDKLILNNLTTNNYRNGTFYLIDLDRRLNSNYTKNLGTLTGLSVRTKLDYNDYKNSSHVYVADMNGDGKSDIIIFDGNINKIHVYNLDSNNNFVKLWETPFNFSHVNSHYGDVIFYEEQNGKYSYNPIFGDLNADGKTDIILPGLERKVLISTGISFISESLPTTFPPRHHYNNFLPTDFNNDGKLDILSIKKINRLKFSITNMGRIGPGQWTSKVHEYVADNAGCPNTIVDLMPFSIITSKIYPDKPQLVMAEFLHSVNCAHGLQLGFYTNQNVCSDNKLITSITEGNGVKTSIDYSSLSDGDQTYFASPQVSNYPMYDIANAPSVKVVKTLTILNNNLSYKKQFYKYYGATSELSGLGYQGFRATSITNWFSNLSEAISRVSKFDMNYRGTVSENFSVTGIALPTVVLDNNSNFIHRSLYTYNNNLSENPLLTNKVYKLRNTFSNHVDGLTGVITEVKSEYDAYNLIKKSAVNRNQNNTESKTVSEQYDYDNLFSGTPYLVGRPKSKLGTITLMPGNDVSKYNETYTYDGDLLKTVKKQFSNSGLSTSLITESNNYDGYGNITTKTISVPGFADRTSSFQYDTPTHRFITKKIDILGQATDYTYDNSTGLVLGETLPSNQGYALKTTFVYDTWGKLLKKSNYLGNTLVNSVSHTYTNTNDGIQQNSTGSDGSASKIIFDKFNRKIHEQAKDINANWVCVSTQYDINNNIIKASKPYFINGNNLGTYSVWDEMQYDIYGRIKQSNSLKSLTSNGKQTVYTYNELSATETDNQKQKTTTNNVYGSVASVNETGGTTIQYKYFANGNLKSTTTSDSEITIEQDAWGRKQTLIDPSAGTRRYLYNGFGELISEEVEGKGITTYDIDNYGRTLSETTIGSGSDNTNIKTTYSYNAAKLLQSVVFNDKANNYIINYDYTYDNYRRLKKKTEIRTSTYDRSKKYFDFEKEYIFDGLGRIEKEHYYAKDLITNKLSDKWIKTIFKNGYKYQLYDMVSSTATGSTKLWQTNTVDQFGNVTAAIMGNSVNMTKSYNQYGFPAMTRDYKNSTGVMLLQTSFNPVNGNLVNRTYNTSWNENLSYDSLDRLTSYKNVSGYQYQSYNGNGTIASNNIGAHEYTLQSQPFNLTSITPTDQTVNSQVINYYTNREQNVSYNVFKNPVFITEENKEYLDFEYNALRGRSVMYYGDIQPGKLSRMMRKFYSNDGSMEIKRKAVSGVMTNDFITYIGGDAYTAPVIFKSDGTTKAYYYLHRDYQGSVMAVSNSSGSVVEKRLFDVWGSLISYSSGTNTTLPTTSTGLFIDRGYTGHESLLGVGLINMNGRIYDPKLHRFLQPDNNIQDPFNPQNYNRYGYCLNNPTKYTDPSGELWGELFGFLFSTYVHGAQATGNPNPLKWNAGQITNAVLAPTSAIASITTTDFANGYIDNYNKHPEINSNAAVVEEHPYTWNQFKWDLRIATYHGDAWMSKWGRKVLGSVAEFHPGVAIQNAYGAYTDGKDIFGEEVSVTGANFQVVSSVLPAIKFYKLGTAVSGLIKFGEVEQYTLRTIESGFYPVMTRGFKKAQELVWLEAGEIWKIGTTRNFNPLSRYTQKYLKNLGEFGVKYESEFRGTIFEALQVEKMKIVNYLEQYGVLPAGNKIIK